MADAILAQSGIYSILNTVNGRRYIGQSMNIHRRNVHHMNSLRRGDHHCSHLQRSYSLHGSAAFLFVPLEICAVELLTSREQYWMDVFAPSGTYNEAPAAGTTRGRTHTDEAKAKIAAALTGKKHSAERRAQTSAVQIGRGLGLSRAPFSEEWRANISAARAGKKSSAEAKRKISASLMGNSNTAGRQLSDEHKQKISAALRSIPPELRTKKKKRMPRAAEHSERIAARMRENWSNPEYRARMASMRSKAAP